MLFIPDIHINHKYSDQILYHIDKYITDNSEQKDIVFLGDYVFVFSLDTNAINRLLDLIIKHFHNDKNIYILTGNHDWIRSDFVYAQAQKAFDILNKSSTNKIYFITQPLITNIDGKDILFLPYMISKTIRIYDQNKNIYYQNYLTEDFTGKGFTDINEDLLHNPISQTILDLKKSKNHNHQISGEINHAIYTARKSYEKLVIIHHYYIHGVKFPGTQSSYNYGSVALSPNRLQDKNIHMISGHLHKSFQTLNYLCCGSVWHASASEVDQIKFLRKRNISENNFFAEAIYINPYIMLEYSKNILLQNNNDLYGGLFFDISQNNLTDGVGDLLSQNNIDKKYKQIVDETKKLFLDNVFFNWNQPNHKDVSIIIETIGEVQIEIPLDLFSNYKDIRIKKKSIINKIDGIDTDNLDLKNNFISRKDVAKKFISDKYGKGANVYIEYLQKMHIDL